MAHVSCDSLATNEASWVNTTFLFGQLLCYRMKRLRDLSQVTCALSLSSLYFAHCPFYLCYLCYNLVVLGLVSDLVLECRQVINYGRKSPVLHVQLAVKLAILLKEELRYVC